MPSRKVRPEQLGWNLVDNLVMTASGNYFSFDDTGSVVITFKGINQNRFSVRRNDVILFQVLDDGTMTLGGNPSASGNFFVGNNVTVEGNGQFSGSLFVSQSITAADIIILDSAQIGRDLFVTGNIHSGEDVYVGRNLYVTESAYIAQDLYVAGTIFGVISASISGTAEFAKTSSHLEEEGMSIYSPLTLAPTYTSGGFWYSSSGEWFLS